MSSRTTGSILMLWMWLFAVLASSCVPLEEPAGSIGTQQASGAREPPLFFAAYATPIEEPWDGVIHRALQRAASEGEIRHEYTDDIGYSGDSDGFQHDGQGRREPGAPPWQC